jgi:hypothetical protein
MKGEDKNGEFKRVMGEIKRYVEQVFVSYGREVERKNEDQIRGKQIKN